jgi:hypothetical protein
LQATFGELDAKYFHIPPVKDACSAMPYMKRLGELLAILRERNAKARTKARERIEDRKVPKAPILEEQNRYQPGDFVLYKLEKLEKSSKVGAKNRGPYVVTSHKQGSNHVNVKDMTDHKCMIYDCKDLSICVATHEEALAAARKEKNQHAIVCVMAFRGEFYHKTRMQFLVQFGDGDELWLNWSTDITNTEAFEKYCVGHRFKMLRLLLLSVKQVTAVKTQVNRELIPVKCYNSEVFINLRSYGGDWYDSRTKLPNKDYTEYYLRAQVSRTKTNNPKKCTLSTKVFKGVSEHDWFYMEYFGNIRKLLPGEVELTEAMVEEYGLNV